MYPGVIPATDFVSPHEQTLGSSESEGHQPFSPRWLLFWLPSQPYPGIFIGSVLLLGHEVRRSTQNLSERAARDFNPQGRWAQRTETRQESD